MLNTNLSVSFVTRGIEVFDCLNGTLIPTHLSIITKIIRKRKKLTTPFRVREFVRIRRGQAELVGV